ncbi:ribonuclease HI family protein [Aerococcus kribbianus]|uniref:Ribonuclease HI family protein n=1 Tax=Aerococcus kribbianus TaxID=2999064 RepID=A0A9X3FLZ0_9LACT|nr:MULTISPECIES: ribonuclease HI family protein [unclassified Aerococcus]MCZ0716940.1 ribonuclease HI family protein [Aerococcus sp. YH-aer221]MCZ0725228.1 ribonuclease HI family protein [Aerococcus sp. YH-aer222]
MIRLSIDGSVDNQYGKAGVGIVWNENKQSKPFKFPLQQEMDNHQAEFWALRIAIELLKKAHKEGEIILCQTDSRTVFDAVEKNYHPQNTYNRLAHRINEDLADFDQFNLLWVPERDNRGADNLAKQALQMQS